MDPISFIKTIYLGDRSCQKIIIDALEEEVSIQVDEISRVRNPSGQWDFYNDENIVDGFIVINSVKSFHFQNGGLIPNYLINYLTAKQVNDEKLYEFEFSINSHSFDGDFKEIVFNVVGGGIFLRDPRNPSVRITS